LYSREADHFILEKGVVDPAQDMPAGVGEVQYIQDPADPQAKAPAGMMGMGMGMRTGKPILVDPMTREEIGAAAVLDQYGRPMVDATGKPRLKERDHWFTLQFKLLWKNGPAGAPTGAAKSSTPSAVQPGAQAAPQPAAKPAERPASRSSKSRKTPSVGIE
jgi:hypothetical protein